MKLPFKILCVCMLLILSTTEVYSQRTASGQSNAFPHLNNSRVGELPYTGTVKEDTFENAVAKTKGSQFYDENFSKATISETNNLFKLRYNAFLDEMEIIDGNVIVFINKEQQKNLISFTEKNVAYKVLKENTDNAKETLGYFVVMEENSAVSLYRKDRKKFVPSSRLVTRDDSKFQNVRSSFYIEINNSGTAMKLPKNKKEFAALFPDKSTEILAYIKSEKLKVRKEEDLKKLIHYINSI